MITLDFQASCMWWMGNKALQRCTHVMRGASTMPLCHSILLSSTDVNIFLVLWVSLYEGKIVSQGVGILNTSKTKTSTDTSFTVTKKKF